MDEWQNWLPMWAHDSLDLMLVALQVGGIVLVAWLLRRSVGKLFDKIVAHHKVPVDVAVPMKTIGGWIIIVTAGMLVLERLGVSGQVLWTAITGFAAVAAVAFFAAWSVLSNIFCAFLIFSTQPFRVGDELEILDASDKVGMHGRVLAIHLLYTVLEEVGRADGRPTLIQVPNSAFFQKTIRRWQSGDGEPSI
jgi:small-conductance mechanosensitive channel